MVRKFLEKREEVYSFLRFATVGGLGSITDLGVLNLMAFVLHLPILLANTISISVAILQNYWLHRRWTFANQEKDRVKVQLAKFAVTSLIGLVLSNLMLGPLVSLWTGVISELIDNFVLLETLSTNMGKLTSIGIVLSWNYATSRFWTFRSIL